ncbi:hypothetical protein [Burkholderia sp. NFPP32]|nr:hypothetical protein [Burkholderia sp. NFPP32]
MPEKETGRDVPYASRPQQNTAYGDSDSVRITDDDRSLRTHLNQWMVHGAPPEVDVIDVETEGNRCQLSVFIGKPHLFRLDVFILGWRPLVDATLTLTALDELADAAQCGDAEGVHVAYERVHKLLSDPRNWMRAVPPTAEIFIDACRFRDDVKEAT